MGFSSTIKASLGLDTSLFASGLKQAGNMAGEAGKAIHRKLGAGDAFKSIVAAVGISVDSIAEKLARLYTGVTLAEEGRLREMVEASDRAADAAVRRLEEARRKKAQAEEETRRARAEFQKAQSGILYDSLSLSDQIRYKEMEAADARERSGAITKDSAEKYRLMQKAAEATAEAERLRAKRAEDAARAEKDKADTQKKADEERKKALEAIGEASRQQLDDVFELLRRATQARQALGAARANYAQALRDQSGASLSEITSGQRGTAADQSKARAVARLRARAQRVRDMGGEFRDSAGKVVDAAAYADQLTTRANQIQSGIGGLASSERDPLAAYKDALAKTEEELTAIRRSLEDESTK